MNCVVTAGPTYESLDEVRRLTNCSTGALGSQLANHLVERGHDVTLLLGYYATYHGEQKAQRGETFTTTADLRERLQRRATQGVEAVFHAAAVSDFTFGQAWERQRDGALQAVRAGKLSTRQGALLVELLPTPKILSELRDWFPTARLIGWKYEVDGDRASVIALAARQLIECRTDLCVANGRAYGAGFGLVRSGGDCVHVADRPALFAALER